MTTDAQQSAGCPDGGHCAHRCLTGCWRVVHARPLADYGSRWPDDVRRRHGTVVQDGLPTAPAPEGMHDRILRAISDHVDQYGYPPTLAQIGDTVGLTSTSSVHHHLGVMEARGLITRDPRRPRAITLTSPPDTTSGGHCPTCTCETA